MGVLAEEVQSEETADNGIPGLKIQGQKTLRSAIPGKESSNKENPTVMKSLLRKWGKP